jgi:multimeric flavodoxin WrbA
MLVLGLHGSPRKKGNTYFLLSAFLDEAARMGAKTQLIDVPRKNIIPCKELVVCEKKGFCPLDDDMKHEIYPLLREADVIVAASPVFFYNVTAQLKALIDRCQTLWARKYCLKLVDPARKYRRGFMLAAGATKGKNLFEGVKLTAQYFFDAVGARFEDSLNYRQIEGPKDMQNHPTAVAEVKDAVHKLLEPLIQRKKVLFACRENACRSQMASAFAQFYAGDKMDVLNGGSQPAEKINPVMVEAMQEKGIDMAFRIPKSIEAAIDQSAPEMIITMGCGEACPFVPGAQKIDWDLPDPAGQPIEFMRRVRDDIEKRVQDLIKAIV